MERVQRPAAAFGDDRGSRRRRRLSPLRHVAQRDRRSAPRRRGLSYRRHEEPGGAGYRKLEGLTRSAVAVAHGGILRGQIVRLGILSAEEAPLVDIAQGVDYLSRDG